MLGSFPEAASPLRARQADSGATSVKYQCLREAVPTFVLAPPRAEGVTQAHLGGMSRKEKQRRSAALLPIPMQRLYDRVDYC